MLFACHIVMGWRFCAVQTSPSVARLDVGNCDLETDAVIALSTVLQSNRILQELNLENPRLFSRMVSGIML